MPETVRYWSGASDVAETVGAETARAGLTVMVGDADEGALASGVPVALSVAVTVNVQLVVVPVGA